MNGAETNGQVELPAELRRQFDVLRQRLWRLETILMVCRAIGALLISYLVVLVADRFGDTPAGFRMALNASATVFTVFSVLLWARRWWGRCPDDRELAVVVQGRFRRLGDRLLGIVELAEEREHHPGFSPELYRAAIRQVAREALQHDFRESVHFKRAKALAGIGAVLGVLAFLPWLLSAELGKNALVRWLTPWSSEPRFTLVRLVDLPNEQVTALGEAFELQLGVRYASVWKPARVSGQIAGQKPVRADVRHDRARLAFAGQTQPTLVRIRLGDVRQDVRVRPVHRPALKEASATVHLPDYLGQPSRQESVTAGAITVLEGSRISLQAAVSRELQKAEQISEAGDGKTLTVQENTFSTARWDAANDQLLTFSWTDRFGLSNAAPWRLTVKTERDQAPLVELAGFPRDAAVLEGEFVALIPRARDDYGVRNLEINWRVIDASLNSNQAPQRAFEKVVPDAQTREVAGEHRFSPLLAGAPPESTIELQAVAHDYHPDRGPGFSAIHRLHVVGNDRHAELMRQRFENMMAHLEEVTRLQEQILSASRTLAEKQDSQLSSAASTSQLDKLRQEQAQAKAALQQLAREGTAVLREASRNPTIQADLLASWVQNLELMNQVANEPMSKATSSLGKARESSASSRQKEVKEAVTQETQALAGLEQLQRQANEALDQLQAQTLAQRLRRLSKGELAISGRILKLVPETIGLEVQDLTPFQRGIYQAMSGDQKEALEEGRTLEGEIGRFYERTGRAAYGQVSGEMKTNRLADHLDGVREQIDDNLAMLAVQNLHSLARQFEHWANLLEPRPADSGSGGSSGEGQGRQRINVLQQLIQLVRMRNDEVNVRAKTGALEQRKDQDPRYPQLAQGILVNQEQITGALIEASLANQLPFLESLMRDAYDSMTTAETGLARPDTGQPTLLAQNRAIQELTDAINLINEQAQRGESSSSSEQSSAAQAAIEMLSMPHEANASTPTPPTGGGNPGGGGDTLPNAQTAEGSSGQGDPARATGRGSGRSSGNLPSEFRDALEHYFRSIDTNP